MAGTYGFSHFLITWFYSIDFRCRRCHCCLSRTRYFFLFLFTDSIPKAYSFCPTPERFEFSVSCVRSGHYEVSICSKVYKPSSEQFSSPFRIWLISWHSSFCSCLFGPSWASPCSRKFSQIPLVPLEMVPLLWSTSWINKRIAMFSMFVVTTQDGWMNMVDKLRVRYLHRRSQYLIF